MDSRGFEFCCGMSEVGEFWFRKGICEDEILEDIRGCFSYSAQIATLNKQQLPRWEPRLVKLGFVKVGTFINSTTKNLVALFARGLNLEKVGPMPTPKKSKKTITLKTGKKIVKKTRATKNS